MTLPIPHKYTRIVTDSRQATENSFFVAIKGEKSDGHDFLFEAQKRGATAALVSSSYSGESFGLDLTRVEDPVLSLQKWPKETLEFFDTVKVVAVTGSVGKTSTKDFISTLLSAQFCVSKTQGNLNSKIGLPLTVLNELNKGSEVLVLEMGMSEKGNIKYLTEIAPPDIAVITAVSFAHAANFSSIEQIAEAKAEIFTHKKTKYGLLPEGLVDTLSLVGTCEKVVFEPVSTRLPKHHHGNVSAAIHVATLLGMSGANIKKMLPALTLPPKRMEVTHKEGVEWINDSYNASPLAMKGALETLKESTKRRVAVLGEMRELGIFSADEHRLIGEYAVDCADLLFTLGDETKPLYKVWKDKGRNAYFAADLEELRSLLNNHIKNGDAVLVKGSNSLKMWKLL